MLRTILSILLFSAGTATADGIALTVDRGAGVDDVALSWVGGEASFRLFRAPLAPGLVASSNEIGETGTRSWSDSPVSDLTYYRVTGDVPVQSLTLTYGPNSAQRLDLYLPIADPILPMPVVVLAHGGLWQSGSRGDLSTLCSRIVFESGGTQACASIDYRLSQNLGGSCTGTGIDTYRDQLDDMAAAFALLQDQAATYDLDPLRMHVGGHSAGGHLAQTLNLRWSAFCPSCPPALGAIGFEGIYDIAAWDAYDASFWNGAFTCATRKAFGAPPTSGAPCVDPGFGESCWEIGSPIYLANEAETLGVAPVGDALIIHSPGDDWVDIAEATLFGAAMSAAFPERSVTTTIDGTCATGQHNNPLGQTRLAVCIADFIAPR